MRIPAANAVSPARRPADAAPTRPIGTPRKIVPPAIAPRSRVCVVLNVRGTLHEMSGVRSLDGNESRRRRLPGDDLFPGVSNRGVPALSGHVAGDRRARRRDARRLARVGWGNAET